MNAVVKHEEAQAPVTLLATLARAASEPSVDVAKMTALYELMAREEARQAERAFNGAMADAQALVQAVKTDAKSDKARYATYAQLDREVRPIYSEHGFSLSFDTDAAEGESVKILCYVAHREGHSRTYSVSIPCDGKGAKGGEVMTRTHAVGSAMSYGMRYLLRLIFNIPIGEADDDGKAAGERTREAVIDVEQLKTLRELIEKMKADIVKFCDYFRIGSLVDLPAKDYEKAIAMLNLREKKVQK